ncbi:MAG: FHA domain-containing protein [Wenzhouxiangella sp.]|nr:FHA domain-containing protein [Wenzhouxiangella sp.]
MTDSAKKSVWHQLSGFLAELQRRKVVQTTVFYLLAAWGLSAGAADIFGALGLPEIAARYAVIGIFAMTPVVAVISWLYDVNTRGIHRDHGPPDQQISSDTEVAKRDNRVPLTLRYGDQVETFYRDVIVGRDDTCAFQIIEPLISRRHVKFEFIGGRWRASDLGSANGTLLDGREIDKEWLTSDASLLLYPDGPTLEVTVAGPGESANDEHAPIG